MKTLFCLTILLSAALVLPVCADPVSLEGNWSGSGTVQQTQGPAEKLRCRINYKRETDKVFSLRAKCATTSNQINQTGELLKINAGLYVGEFYIASYDIGGRIRIVIEGTVQTMTFKSSRAHGQLTLKKS
jgi:hypothetical protein